MSDPRARLVNKGDHNTTTAPVQHLTLLKLPLPPIPRMSIGQLFGVACRIQERGWSIRVTTTQRQLLCNILHFLNCPSPHPSNEYRTIIWCRMSDPRARLVNKGDHNTTTAPVQHLTLLKLPLPPIPRMSIGQLFGVACRIQEQGWSIRVTTTQRQLLCNILHFLNCPSPHPSNEYRTIIWCRMSDPRARLVNKGDHNTTTAPVQHLTLLKLPLSPSLEWVSDNYLVSHVGSKSEAGQ